MKHASPLVIYPNHLIYDPAIVKAASSIQLIEHPHLFTTYAFHKQKLIYHRATMKAYETWLRQHHVKVTYLPFFKAPSSPLPPPPFLTPEETFPQADHYFFHSFYIKQRKRFELLLDHGKPMGGKWSYDRENRVPATTHLKLPKRWIVPQAEEITEAMTYVNTHFPNNPGKLGPPIFPVTRKDALTWLRAFISSSLKHFGTYEDAILSKETFLFHSGLSPMLNTGLLTADEVIEAALQASDIPLNSLEGFIRQMIGWREFVYLVYLRKGEEQQQSNFFRHHRKIPPSFWQGTTGILPIDCCIKKVLENGYLHHIERLMVVGCFMLLCEFDPKEVYRWFMELFIDSDTWVMVPNVFGMSQYADGGIMTTKPYLCSSRYLRKMADYPKGEWEQLWDGLYWRFLKKHEKTLRKNPRMRLMLTHDFDSKKPLIRLANQFLQSLDTE